MVGTYDIVITGSNLLGDTSKTYRILAQIPVTQQFTLTSNAPQQYPPGKKRVPP